MALFKILKGESTRIGTEITPFHEGYAYFTPDDGGFYIDAIVGEEEQKRVRINPPGGTEIQSIPCTLLGAGWKNNQQTLQIEQVKQDSNGFLGLSQDITGKPLEAAFNAGFYISGQDDGSITVSAYGESPSVDIPVLLILIG